MLMGVFRQGEHGGGEQPPGERGARGVRGVARKGSWPRKGASALSLTSTQTAWEKKPQNHLSPVRKMRSIIPSLGFPICKMGIIIPALSGIVEVCIGGKLIPSIAPMYHGCSLKLT